jgi:hypothetical protein
MFIDVSFAGPFGGGILARAKAKVYLLPGVPGAPCRRFGPCISADAV